LVFVFITVIIWLVTDIELVDRMDFLKAHSLRQALEGLIRVVIHFMLAVVVKLSHNEDLLFLILYVFKTVSRIFRTFVR
jgi:hypothetical protein